MSVEWIDSGPTPDWLPFPLDDPASAVANAQTRSAMIQIGENLFPVTINETEYESSYVCSPYNALITYGAEEVGKLRQPVLEALLRTVLCSYGGVLRYGQINCLVSVNNWLLSTNLFPAWTGDGLAEATDLIRDRFPDHGILFRSLNQHTNAPLIETAQRVGYRLVPSRQVYVFDTKLTDYAAKANTRRDLKLLDSTHYAIGPVTPADYPRIVELYNQLYLEKYSMHNPHFTETFIVRSDSSPLFDLVGLRGPDGVLDGVVGMFARDGVITAPIVGYATALPQDLGLYRMLMAIVLRRGLDSGWVINLSSGAAHFKRLRGAVPFIEYSAFYGHHLPGHQRLVWAATALLLSSVGVPLLKHHQL